MKRKVVKMRGSKTHGYGSKKKHRGAGSRGGRGKAGLKKHKKLWMLKHDRDHFGKKGFRSLTQKGLKSGPRAVNVGDLEMLAGSGKEVDLKALGYDKVIGSGTVRKPLSVKAGAFSKKAKEKVEKAGGKVIKHGKT
jgi:large subunit ribosomal protein L15